MMAIKVSISMENIYIYIYHSRFSMLEYIPLKTLEKNIEEKIKLD
jgi:hypothetical protein